MMQTTAPIHRKKSTIAVRDGQEPFDQRKPATELLGVGIREIEMDRLLLVGRGVVIAE